MIIVSGRKLLVPQGERYIGFEGDNLVETRIFAITDKALFDMDFVVDFGKEKGCVVLEKRLSDDESVLELKLDITAALLTDIGVLAYQLRGVDSQGERRWHSEIGGFVVSNSHNSENIVTQQELSEFEQLERLAFSHCNKAQSYSQNAKQWAIEADESCRQTKAAAEDVEQLQTQAIKLCEQAKEYAELVGDSTAVVMGISKNSVMQQGNNKSGCKGVRIVKIDDAQLVEGAYYAAYTVDGDAEKMYAIGDACTIRLDINYDNCGEIFAVLDNVIMVKLYGTNVSELPLVLNDSSQGDENTFRVPSKPNVGNIDIGVSSFASGDGNYAVGAYSFASGYGNRAIGKYSFAEGFNNVASYGAHAEGKGNEALGEQSHAEGLYTKSMGQSSHAEGDESTASGKASHAEGYKNKAEGDYSHAEGSSTLSSGQEAHAEGSNTISSGARSHAEGINTKATGNNAHAEGSSTEASGVSSHSEGGGTKATGAQAHAEGINTTASAPYAHAEGNATVASGNQSHAEGIRTQAIGSRSHAEGYEAISKGISSHAEGEGTIAEANAQHVQGKYNVGDSQGKYAHIVGGGSSDSDRKNIHTLDWDGNAFYSGSIEASQVILRSSTAGSTKKFKLTVDDGGVLSVTEI